jgi:RNA ligase
MFYDFPVGLTLDEVRRVVADHNARLGEKFFIERDAGDHVIFNYVVSTPASFPQPGEDAAIPARDAAIIRECRGLIFAKSGELLARRWAKFFNVNEKSFTQAHLIDWDRPHDILEKLDGSMITPFYAGGTLRWGTKMGITDVAAPVEAFVEENFRYVSFAWDVMACGLTPIFEWCSRKQKIVVDYPQDALILTGLRENHDGTLIDRTRMISWAERFGIPVVRALPGSVGNIETFMAEARDLVGEEGYIIRFDNGHQLKVKGAWYCAIHSTKDKLQFEKDVWALVLNDQMDDAMALMDAADRDRCERFVTAMNEQIGLTADGLTLTVDLGAMMCMGDKKRFATEFVKDWPNKAEVPLLFAIWDGHDPREVVRNYLKKHTSTITRVNIARSMVNGLTWDDYRDRNLVLDD